MPEKNILILTCSTGEGHNCAARAVEAELADRGIACEVKDVLGFKGGRAVKRASDVYSAVIKNAPSLFGFVYRLGRAYDNSRLPSPIYRRNSKYAGRLYSYLTENRVTHVICTHLFAMEAMTAVRRKYGSGIKCYGVLTDYTAIPFYKDTDLDGYFTAEEKSGLSLISKGIPAGKVYVTGIPVHKKFREETDKSEARGRLGIPADKKVIAVMTGGAGCGKTVKLCAELAKLKTDRQVYVLCGRNKKLADKLKRRFAGANIRAVEFTPDVHLYMKSADVLITKAGGLSSTEGAVAGVPIVHLKAIPGCETANLKYFSGNGLSLRADSVKRAVSCAEQLVSDEALSEVMIKIQKLFICGTAVNTIVNIVTEDKADEYISMACVYGGRVSLGQYNVLPDYTRAYNA